MNKFKRICEEHESEFLRFRNVKNKRSNRSDLNAFILLDEILPQSDLDIVRGAEHDIIYVDGTPEQLELVDEELLLDLYRCGVRYDSEYDCLAMFT